MATDANASAPTQTIDVTPQFGAVADIAIRERLVALYNRIPTGPIGSGRSNTAGAAERGCWAVDEDATGQLTVAIPSNLEAWADDSQAIVGVAALAALPNINLVIGSEWPISQHLTIDQKAANQYFSGVAHALRYAPVEHGHDYSGSFGHGVAFVTHHWAATHDIEPWLIKGSAKSVSQVLTRQAWATGLPVELRRLEQLIRRAASSLPDGNWIANWSKTSAQLAGHGIKQTVSYKKVGVVSQNEVDWISNQYSPAEIAYNELRAILDSPTKSYEDLRSIPSRNRQVAGLLRIPSDLHDKVTRDRFSALSRDIPKRDLARENRKPIAERLRDMDIIDKFAVMHPLFLRGRRFVFHEDTLTGIQARNPIVIGGIQASISRFTEAEPDPQLRALAVTWFADAISALIPDALE